MSEQKPQGSQDSLAERLAEWATLKCSKPSCFATAVKQTKHGQLCREHADDLEWWLTILSQQSTKEKA